MDPLAKLRQDPAAFAVVAVAETVAIATNGPPYNPPLLSTTTADTATKPAPVTVSVTPPVTVAPPADFGSPEPWLNPVRVGPWLVTPAWPDDPAEMGAVPLVEPAAGVAAIPLGPTGPQPRRTPAPCDCGCPWFWEDLAGELHCVLCVLIPARSMAVEAWKLVEHGERRWWAVWEPGRWNLFEHLEAEEAAAAAAKADTKGF